jgi:hypothetical protein
MYFILQVQTSSGLYLWSLDLPLMSFVHGHCFVVPYSCSDLFKTLLLIFLSGLTLKPPDLMAKFLPFDGSGFDHANGGIVLVISSSIVCLSC